MESLLPTPFSAVSIHFSVFISLYFMLSVVSSLQSWSIIPFGFTDR